MSFLESWYEDNISGKDGKYEGRGIGAFLLKPLVDEDAIEQRVQGNRNRETALRLGYDLSELPSIKDTDSTYAVQGAAIKKGKEEKRTKEEQARSDALKPYEMQLTDSREARAAESERYAAERQQSNRLSLLQLAETKDARIADLQYQKMRDRKSDQQYNERMQQLDRRDRRTAVQNMVSGLAALGAAFAV